jgi:hypothetical protein
LSPSTSPPTSVSAPVITNSIVELYVKNDTARIDVTGDIVDQVDVLHPSTSEYEIVYEIHSEERGTITNAIFELVNNDTAVNEAILLVRYGSAASYASTNLQTRRRALQSSTNIVIELYFDLTSDLLSTIDGLTLDDPAFEAALIAALGLANTTDLVVTSNGGDITITAVLYAEDSSDPLGVDLLQTAQDLQNDLTNITNVLLNEIGAVGTQLLQSTLDLCPEARDCTDNGVCDDDTGVCECVGDWWGINCETPCTCANGSCVNAYCQCQFPYYGLRCDVEKDCCGI